jgi:hypothetical protein
MDTMEPFPTQATGNALAIAVQADWLFIFIRRSLLNVHLSNRPASQNNTPIVYTTYGIINPSITPQIVLSTLQPPAMMVSEYQQSPTPATASGISTAINIFQYYFAFGPNSCC